MPSRRLSRWSLLLVALCNTGDTSRADTSVNVPLQHWSYAYVERFEAKGVLHAIGDGIKPWSRLELAAAVSEITSRAGRGLALSRIEREQLQLLQGEFKAELAELRGESQGGAGVAGKAERLRQGQPLLCYRHEQGEMLADVLLRQQTDLFTGRGRAESERVFRHRVGGAVRGHIGGRLGFRMSFEQVREHGSRTYELRGDVYERRLEIPQLKGGLTDYHEGMGYAVVSLPFARMEFGKDEVNWGPAPDDNLGLSHNAPAFDMLRLRADIGAFKLVSIAGALSACPDRPDSPVCGGTGDEQSSYIVNGVDRRLEREKYLAAHRLEVALAPWLDLGFQEAVVYGDRSPQVAYLNPLMFYWAAQSYLGDKDNAMMGLDLDFHPGRGVRFYLAYLADDMQKLRLFSNDFVNKFALQAGMLWVDPLRLRDAELRADYVRIEPWIYTHKIPINTFRHFDAPLGHSLGPNSDRWRVQLGRRFSRDLELRLEASRTRHGDNELLPDGGIRNVGGDLHLGWRAGDERETKQFLDGRVGTWFGLGGKAVVRLWPQLWLEAGLVSAWGSNVPLPPRWGPNVALENRSGYGSGRQQQVSLEMRYSDF